MCRSPPPVNWPSSAAVDRGGGAFPLSPRSTNGTFSPDSSDGLEIDCNSNNNANLGGGSNYYVRSHSEEHILSPCRDLLRTGMHGVGIGGGGGPVRESYTIHLRRTVFHLLLLGLFFQASPPHLQHNQLSLLQRGATPDLLMTTSLYAGVGAGDGGPGSPRPSSSVQQQMQMQQQQQQQIQQLKHQKIRRNHTLNLSTDVLGGGDFYYSAGPASASSAVSPFRNQGMGYDCDIDLELFFGWFFIIPFFFLRWCYFRFVLRHEFGWRPRCGRWWRRRRTRRRLLLWRTPPPKPRRQASNCGCGCFQEAVGSCQRRSRRLRQQLWRRGILLLHALKPAAEEDLREPPAPAEAAAGR